MANKNLKQAKKAKNDEFYTRLTDIEKEMKYYRESFRGKVIYCNCDDARHSKFFTFFANGFEFLGLKKLITTSYNENGKGTVLVYEGDKNGNLMPDDEEIKITELKGNGDFRSEECIEFLKEADIVVTNPPFSLFREYVAQLMEYNKKFIIIGNMNAITYKEIFPLIKNNQLWLGYSPRSMTFISPEKKEETVNAVWFTNIEHKKRHEIFDLYKKYSFEEFPKYDNYDAINVDKTCDIPLDYDGVMGVPITFLDKYNPDQFEIVGLGNSRDNFTPNKDYINPKKHLKDSSIVNGNAINCVLSIEVDKKPEGIFYTSDNSKYLLAPYARILIRHKK